MNRTLYTALFYLGLPLVAIRLWLRSRKAPAYARRIAERFGVHIIEDDVYGELYFGESRPIPAKAFDHAGLVMHCGSFSKKEKEKDHQDVLMIEYPRDQVHRIFDF